MARRVLYWIEAWGKNIYSPQEPSLASTSNHRLSLKNASLTLWLAITELQKYNHVIPSYIFIKRSYILQLMIASNVVDRKLFLMLFLEIQASDTKQPWHFKWNFGLFLSAVRFNILRNFQRCKLCLSYNQISQIYFTSIFVVRQWIFFLVLKQFSPINTLDAGEKIS